MTRTLRESRLVEQRARRPRVGLGLLLAVILLLVAIVVVVDRASAQVASRELRAQLASELSDRGVGYQSLDVSIGGFPFLTQVADGHFQEITIDMAAVALPPSEGIGEVTLPALTVVATGITADTMALVQGTNTTVTADEVSGTAVIAYHTLETLVDYSRYRLRDVTFTDTGGAVRATATADVAGIEVEISAVAELSVVDGEFQLDLSELTAVGREVPSAVADFLDDLAQRAITARLPQLPFGLTLVGVRAEPTGLAVTAIGRDVSLIT